MCFRFCYSVVIKMIMRNHFLTLGLQKLRVSLSGVEDFYLSSFKLKIVKVSSLLLRCFFVYL
ncbi:hypothetical protein CCAN11_1390004 [Capnocytophaga canimorsus]|uniref:Uncharacterized protein n=1 Tax=Capnocytophaga canimorsus TaxID=28188 RepID=A0A0B7I9G4_9FLAO|nr:hypothetical protein CCAN11_1390004 [Capnocytophaga canimorsus]